MMLAYICRYCVDRYQPVSIPASGVCRLVPAAAADVLAKNELSTYILDMYVYGVCVCHPGGRSSV